jgi:hypothetical protein
MAKSKAQPASLPAVGRAIEKVSLRKKLEIVFERYFFMLTKAFI